MSTLRSRQCNSTLGAIVTGVKLKQIDKSSEEFAEILSLFWQRGVLIFPRQHLTLKEQVNFAELIGPLERIVGSDEPLAVISNIGPDGYPVAPESELSIINRGNQQWHADSSFKQVPALASFLSCEIAPSHGGETEWADLAEGFNALSDLAKQALLGVYALHSLWDSQSKVGGGLGDVGDEIRSMGYARHPVISKHPRTGQSVLCIGRHAVTIDGGESLGPALLQILCDLTCQPPRILRHRWAAGDAVLWDNRRVLHRGRESPAMQPRRMTRATIAGDDSENE